MLEYFLSLTKADFLPTDGGADASFIRNNGDGSISHVTAYFHTRSQVITDGQPFDINNILTDLNYQVENWSARGSHFTIEWVLRAIVMFRPQNGNSFIPTPKWLANRYCLVNVTNKYDNKCFIWSMLSALYTAALNTGCISHYAKYENTLNVDGLQFPMPVKLFPKFEENNPSISIDVLCVDTDSKGFCMLYNSPHRDRICCFNILLLEAEYPSNPRHYVWIKNMLALVCRRSKHTKKVHVCNSCLHPFSSQQCLDQHVPHCIRHNQQQVEYPDAENERGAHWNFGVNKSNVPYRFTSWQTFESFLTPIEWAEVEKSRRVNIVDRHIVSGFCCYRIMPHAEHQTSPFLYSSPNPMTMFYDHAMSEAREISRILRDHKF